MSQVLPSGPSEREVSRAVERFSAALGAGAVHADPEGTAAYHDPFPVGDRDEFAPAAVVSPSSTEEVQAVVRIANELKVPLWTVSRGKNNAYGGAAPRLRGSVVVELTRMDKVLEVDEESAYVVLEPGVRFFDLHQHLREGGYRLWASPPDLGWGSVIGNGLDRGIGYTPYGDHVAQQCGLEVVLPDGDLLRTGMGGIANSASWHLYQPGYGPAHAGLFHQSNLGIVTKAGVWVMPTPECAMAVDISVRNFDDLTPLIDALRPLRVDGTIQSAAFIGEPLGVASRISTRDDWYQGPGAVPEEVIGQIMEKTGLGRWILFFGLYGSEARVDADFATVQQAFAGIPGIEISGTKYAGDAAEDDVEMMHRTRLGIPGMYSERLTDWRAAPGQGSHIGFSPVLPLRGADAMAAAQSIRAHVEAAGFDYMGAFHAGPRYLNHVVEIIWDGTDAGQVQGVRDLFAVLVAEAKLEGHGEYRTHIAFMDLVADQFDFNDHAQRRLNERLKDALDPNGILAPGKSGIWPASMR
jgi:4-cresol dehydrogenase (hydroxylating)